MQLVETYVYVSRKGVRIEEEVDIFFKGTRHTMDMYLSEWDSSDAGHYIDTPRGIEYVRRTK